MCKALNTSTHWQTSFQLLGWLLLTDRAPQLQTGVFVYNNRAHVYLKATSIRLEKVTLIRLALLICAEQGSVPTLIVMYYVVQEKVHCNTLVRSTVTHRKQVMENFQVWVCDLHVHTFTTCFWCQLYFSLFMLYAVFKRNGTTEASVITILMLLTVEISLK